MIRALFAIMAFVISQQALAQCGPRDAVVAGLNARYGEVPLFEAIAEIAGQQPMSVMVLANARTGTWTFASSPDPSMLCTFLGGKGFRPPSPIKPSGPRL